MKYTTILLDLDDTLIDTVANTKMTLTEIYEDYNFDKYFASFDDFYTLHHAGVSELWGLYNRGEITKDLLQKKRFASSLQHIGEMDMVKIETINADYVERIVKKTMLIDGAKELLDYLKSYYSINILSNGFTEMQYIKMESAGISDYFSHIILSDVVGVNKPHPHIFNYALDKIGINVGETIMIGDNLSTDIEGAKSIGLDQIWFNPDRKPIEGFKPTYMVNKLMEIKNIL